MKGLQRIIAIALILLGGYYLLVAVGVLPSQIVFLSYLPSQKQLAIIAVIIIIIGLLLDDVWRRKIKGAFY